MSQKRVSSNYAVTEFTGTPKLDSIGQKKTIRLISLTGGTIIRGDDFLRGEARCLSHRFAPNVFNLRQFERLKQRILIFFLLGIRFLDRGGSK